MLSLSSAFDILLFGLATWRISYAFVNEDGPFSGFARLRFVAGVRYDEHSARILEEEHWWQALFGGLLNCVYCFSFWCAVFFTVLYLLFPQGTVVLAVPFAISALAIAINRLYEYG